MQLPKQTSSFSNSDTSTAFDKKSIVVIAGEESGDQHAAKFIQTLLKRHPQWQFSGIGGRHMQAAGASVIFDLAKYGVTGLTEVVRQIKVIKKAFKTIKRHLSEIQPDLLILVDYPGFNLRLAKYAKKQLGIRILYYISPQIWAWKAGRIHHIKQYIDHMAVILPFEKDIYQKEEIPVSFVGHPLVAEVHQKKQTSLPLSLPKNKKIIALLPGSRKNEIARHMPIIAEAVAQILKQHDHLHFILPIAESLDPQEIRAYFRQGQYPVSYIQGNAIAAMNASDIIIVASGTASFEAALLHKPMCIFYKGSFLTYLAASQLIRVKYLGLCNLLANKMIVPELLQYDFTSNHLTQSMDELIHSSERQAQLSKNLSQVEKTLSVQNADCSISELIFNLLHS